MIEPGARAGDVATPRAAGSARPGTDQDRAREGGMVHALLPPAPAAGAQDLPDPRRGPGSQRPARVSIGTIEVTVVPPAQPAEPSWIRESPQPGGRAQRGAIPAATAGSGRLRDGLRRWYGTAQG